MSALRPFCLLFLALSVLAADADAQSKARRDQDPENVPGLAAEPQPVNKFGYSKPFPRPDGAIRIATYNVLNLFDQADDPTLSGEFDDAKFATALDRVNQLAAAIRDVDADIIALQEVESLECLTWFRDVFLSDMGYDHLASKDVGYFRGVECSLMSRFPITDVEIWRNAPLRDEPRPGFGWSDIPADKQGQMTFRRSPLKVTVDVRPDYQLTLFVVHHKSGRDYKYQREAEAVRILQLIEGVEVEDPNANIIVLGDFNAAPWDKSLRWYLENGFVDTMAHRTTWNRDPDAPLYKTHESSRVIDYILMNSAAYREFIPGTAHVYGTLAPPDDYDWRNDPKPDGYASDHYPVIIDLTPTDQP